MQTHNVATKIKLLSLDELLGVSVEKERNVVSEPSDSQIVRVPLHKMHEFAGHPYRVSDDEKMAETVESVRRYGVLMPGLVRPSKLFPGEYEIIAGHRRRRASELAELDDMPVVIRDLSDAEATILMVDSNIQREDLLYSERAWAYRMKYEALKQLGVSENGIRNDTVLANEMGMSRNTIQRYIRLTYLIPELLKIVDSGKLPWNTAADGLSYMTQEEQIHLLDVMEELQVIPSGAQACKLKEFSKEGSLTDATMRFVLERQDTPAKVSLPEKKIRQFFPENYTGKQIEDIIYRLLKEWKEQEQNIV